MLQINCLSHYCFLLISISGPPTPEFAECINANWLVKMIMRFLSFGIKKKAIKKEVHFTFLFMKANGKQIAEITKLIESGIIKPVIDKVFPLEDTNKALEYVESGRAKGKVVVKLK